MNDQTLFAIALIVYMLPAMSWVSSVAMIPQTVRDESGRDVVVPAYFEVTTNAILIKRWHHRLFLAAIAVIASALAFGVQS